MKKFFSFLTVTLCCMLFSSQVWADSYDLWIGSTQVTDANKANIRSGVTYNPTTNVLTLNNAEFQCENEHCIESDIEGLKIELVGENVLTSGKNVLLLRKKCTITGNGKLFATSTEKVYLCAAIAVESCQVTIENTTISAEGYAGILGSGLSGNSIIFKNSSIEATGSYCPICFFDQGFTFVDCEITSPANAVYDGAWINLNNQRYKGKVVISPTAAVTKYDLNLGDVQATSKNASDILGDGTASYNPTTKTLTLNGANIATAKGGISLNLGKDCDSVKLVGNNTCGFIWQSNDCVITGSGSLHCTNEIRVAADMLTILNTTVVTDDKISGDEGDEALKIINSNVTVKKDGIGYLNITLEKCAIVQPIGAVNTGRFIELDGKTVSDEIVIEANIFGVKETLSENVKIRMQNRQLTVENSKRDAITIYNVMGQVVAAKQNPNETETFTIPAAGAYIVKVGKGATRVVTL